MAINYSEADRQKELHSLNKNKKSPDLMSRDFYKIFKFIINIIISFRNGNGICRYDQRYQPISFYLCKTGVMCVKSLILQGDIRYHLPI